MRKANRFLRFIRRMRESAIGPDLSHRRNLIRTMVASDALQEAIARGIARGCGVTVAAAEDRARKFAWEIASDFRYPVVRAGELLLERLWRRLYDRGRGPSRG